MSTDTIIPLFCSHYSLGGKSLLTLEEPGKAKPGNPVSVYDLAARGGLKQVFLCDSRIDGFLSAYKASLKAKVQLCYGLKLCVCADLTDKTPESRRTESKVIILIKDTQGYNDLLRISNRAWTEGHFTHRDSSYGRADWKMLKQWWTPHLGLALPYFSSFVARNLLTMSQITPDLPVTHPWVLREVDSRLPFAPLIDAALDRYVTGSAIPREQVVRTKTIYYPTTASFKPYQVFRAMAAKGTFDAPQVDHLASDRFSWEAYEELTKGKQKALDSAPSSVLP